MKFSAAYAERLKLKSHTTCSTRREPDPFAHCVSPIRVAYVVHTFDVGGLERGVARLANGLDRNRFQPLVICLAQSGPAADWIRREDVSIVELGKQPGNDPNVLRRFARVLRERQIDVVHSHNWGTLVETTLARWLAWPLAAQRAWPFRSQATRSPVHLHAERGTVLGKISATGLRDHLRARAMRWGLRRADAVVSNAASVAQRVEDRCGFPAKRIELIPNGVEAIRMENRCAVRKEVRERLGLGNHTFLVGSVGRLQTVKGFATAIEAIAQLVSRGVDIHLLLVGDGPQRDALTAKAASLAVSHRVHLVGLQEEVDCWLTTMDVYVNASLSEGMSQSIVEAMAAGLPMVVTNVGDNKLLVGGADPCGLVVGAADASALAEAIDAFHRQPSRRSHYGRLASIRHADRYSCEKMYRSYEALYRALVSRKGWRLAAQRARSP